jgi:hypothetical protein
MRKRKMKFNIMDVLILLAVAAVAAVLVYVFVLSENTPVDSLGGTPTTKITYVVELTGIDDALSDNISVGETLIDAAKKMNIGTIVAVETRPYVYLGKNLTDGTMELTTVDNKSTIYVTVEADATLTGIAYSISGYDIYVGEKVYLSLPDFTGTGYCISLKAHS